MDDSIHYAFVLETSERKDNWHTHSKRCNRCGRGLFLHSKCNAKIKQKSVLVADLIEHDVSAHRFIPLILCLYCIGGPNARLISRIANWELKKHEHDLLVRLETVFVSVVHLESSPLRSPPSLFWSIVVAAAKTYNTMFNPVTTSACALYD